MVPYKMTRVTMGSTSSPYVLAATMQKHLEQYIGGKYADTAAALMRTTYVDDLQAGGDSTEDVFRFKQESSKILKEGGFSLAGDLVCLSLD